MVSCLPGSLPKAGSVFPPLPRLTPAPRRSAYPIEYIANAKIPCVSPRHPSNIILLTCDARGVLPPISKLNRAQTMFHFISGYTSKMAGTEDGVDEPQATFSSCFAQPFLALHPMRYAKMPGRQDRRPQRQCLAAQTPAGSAPASPRAASAARSSTRAPSSTPSTRACSRASASRTTTSSTCRCPRRAPACPAELLNPKTAWVAGADSFNEEVTKLGRLFIDNFKKYESEATADVVKAGPRYRRRSQNVPFPCIRPVYSVFCVPPPLSLRFAKCTSLVALGLTLGRSAFLVVPVLARAFLFLMGSERMALLQRALERIIAVACGRYIYWYIPTYSHRGRCLLVERERQREQLFLD